MSETRRMLLGLVCLALAACSATSTTKGVSVRSKEEKGEILYQVNDEPAWLTEAELIHRLGRKKVEEMKAATTSYLAANEAEKRHKRDAWLRQTPAEAESDMRRTLPPGFELGIEGLYVIAGQGGPVERRNLALLLKQVEDRCRHLVGEDRALPVGPQRIYYAKDEAGYEQVIRAELGQAPRSRLGQCDPSPPPRLFGLASVGDGSMSHELVHVLLMNDSPRMPGWFNEGLAVAIGCPRVGYRSEKGSIRDVGLYAALEAIQQGKWSSLDRALEHRESAYHQLDQEPLHLPAVGLKTFVGPLSTGRLFVRWLNETGKLPAFYRSIRDGHDAGKALAATFPGTDTIGVERQFRGWVERHDPAALVEAPHRR